jgi:hypothetical protein
MFKRKGENLLHFHKITHYTIKKAIFFVGFMEKKCVEHKMFFFVPVTFNVKHLHSDKFCE